ncbi:Protein of unknown function DUF616, partial [Dillenia turbinata]
TLSHGRKKVGMLLLCLVSAAVFGWVLYSGKGEDASEGGTLNIRVDNVNGTILLGKTENMSPPPPATLSSVISVPDLPKVATNIFLGYTLPPDHPCEKFTLLSPPADKKRTGPSRKFVSGTKPGHNTGFDIDESDLLEMEQCREEVVASAIFGNYDVIQQPKSEAAKKNACFFMFLDEEIEAYVKNTTVWDSTNRIGLRQIVSVRNLPYTDARQNGKVNNIESQFIIPLKTK